MSEKTFTVGIVGARGYTGAELIRLLAGDFTPKKHFGFEAAAWYWHFVDVVWLFLFAFVYVTFG